MLAGCGNHGAACRVKVFDRVRFPIARSGNNVRQTDEGVRAYTRNKISLRSARRHSSLRTSGRSVLRKLALPRAPSTRRLRFAPAPLAQRERVESGTTHLSEAPPE